MRFDRLTVSDSTSSPEQSGCCPQNGGIAVKDVGGEELGAFVGRAVEVVGDGVGAVGGGVGVFVWAAGGDR